MLQLLHLLQNAELVIGVRMHCAILAASVHTPFMLIPHRLKSYDFESSLKSKIWNFIILHDESFDNVTKNKIILALHKQLEIKEYLKTVTMQVYMEYKYAMKKFFITSERRHNNRSYCLSRCNALSKEVMGFHVLEECEGV